ncbi:galactitol-1-phosphate 5-dehydrogenase [Paenibacillus luteus]|uniref:galactitol-1-phosphate 5-dehydrogenase n=1 Tax=Paenibacillus luteus TaxID=2545753 RepID=UPI001143A27D|nr:galactitol-1-phosphate 5-dehydrogenase [Paenibacillus luteus]
MKGCVLHGLGDLRVEEVDTPTPKEGEVLLQIKACGVCGSDIPRVFTKGTYRFPTIPGHEFSGLVVQAGEGVDPSWIGRRAAVFPLLPCRKCASCEIGEFAQCEDYDYMGSRRDGAFAEFICIPIWNLVAAPDTLSYEELAMVEPAAVAVHALRQAGIGIGDQVLISGAGPIGMMLALWARAWGASRVLLADIDPAKLDFAVGQGFPDVYNPLQGDIKKWVYGLTGRGVDISVEGAGSPVSWENCLKSTRNFGKVVLMGNPAGGMSLTQDGYWEILRKQLTISGTWNSSYSDIPRNEWKLAVDYMAAGKLDVKPLISHKVALEGIYEGMVMMRDRKGFFNKVMYVNANELIKVEKDK